MYYGALEAGGTKMVCGVGTEMGEILDCISIPTETPEKTMPALISYFQEKKVAALGESWVVCNWHIRQGRQNNLEGVGKSPE